MPMTPHRQQPRQPLCIAAHGFYLKNVARRTFLPNDLVRTQWIDADPGELVPPEMPNEVIFGDRDQPESTWTIIRLPDGMPGGRARWVNKTQSEHYRKSNGLRFGNFPQDANTDPHLAEADLNNLWEWVGNRWGWDEDLADAVLWLDPNAADHCGLKRERINVNEDNDRDAYTSTSQRGMHTSGSSKKASTQTANAPTRC